MKEEKEEKKVEQKEETVQKDEEREVEEDEKDEYKIKEVKDFDEMNLKEDLLRGIYSYGFEKPSKIQQRAILPIIETKRDIIGQAQSGTGKTATFSVGVLQNLDFKKNVIQALILAPTRELALQIHKVVLALGEYLKAKCHVCVGGMKVSIDIQALKEGPHIVVGTPGRVNHMIDEGFLDVSELKMLVIDEADEMLSIGFKDQIYEIFKSLPEDLQVCLFSATMPPGVLEISEKFMRKPIKILVKKEHLTLEGIRQFYIYVEKEEHKLSTLCDLYKKLIITQCVIFLNSKKAVDVLSEELTKRKFTVSSIHGDMSTEQRELIMKEFRRGATRVLISTDLLARGIDVHHVSLVINYDLPKVKENYVHRIGRSGRYGRRGVAINLVTEMGMKRMKEIEKFYDTQIDEMPEDVLDHI